MNTRDHVLACPITAEAFANFGIVYEMAGRTDPKVFWTLGKGWGDGFTKAPLIAGSGHLGMTQGGSTPWHCAEMERHDNTEEALFCITAPVVLAVAPASLAPAPRRDEIEAFVISPGQVVVIKRGVWHDACRGLSCPAPYFWMAVCGLGGRPWTPIEGGPLLIRADANKGLMV